MTEHARIDEAVTPAAGALGRAPGRRLPALSGRSARAWIADAHRYVKARPVQVLGVALTLGYLGGKLARR